MVSARVMVLWFCMIVSSIIGRTFYGNKSISHQLPVKGKEISEKELLVI